MATLEKIRSKGPIVVVVIGLALLAFVVGDFLNSSSSFFNKSREIVGEIAGEKINIKDFNADVDQMTEFYKIELRRTDLNEEMTSQIRQQVWEALVNEKLLTQQAEKLGLKVGDDELSDRLVGNNIHPMIQQRAVFADEKGQFNRSALLQFYNSLEQPVQGDEQKQQQEKAKSYWNFIVKNVKLAILQEKYLNLVSKAMSVNSMEAKASISERKNTVDVAYVMKPYLAIPDADVKVSDSEIKDLYNKRKEQNKQEANCSLKFVSFDIKPSREDFKEAETWMNRLVNEFKTTTDIAGVVNSNSDIMYDGKPYTAATVPANLKAFAFSASAGAVYGPVFENDTYTMARVVESGIMEADSVKLRHIFLAAKDTAKVDSLVGAINRGADFAELAKKYSAIQQTAANGGEIGWVTRNMQGMDKDMQTKAFAGAAKSVFTLHSAQGVQIMQVMEKTSSRPKVKLAILQRAVVASSRTNSRLFNEAKQFAADLKSENFESRAKAKGVIVRSAADIMKNSDRIMDIPQSRQIIRWVFNSKKNDVSDVFDCGKHYVVAMTTDKFDKGPRSLEQMTEQLKAELIRDKKAEMIIKDLNSKLGSNPSLEGLASNLKDSVKLAKAVSFSSYQFGLAGFEPAVIGKSSVTPLNKVSAPIKGVAGVYVIRTMNKAVLNQPADVNAEKMQLNGRLSYAMPNVIFQDIRDKSDIEDNRLNFF